MTSEDIISQALDKIDKPIGETLVVFFEQKYSFESELEYVKNSVLVFPIKFDWSEGYEFDWDFCEGQECVRNIEIFSLNNILEYFYLNDKGGDLTNGTD